MLSRPKHVVQKGKMPPTGSGPVEAKKTVWVWPWRLCIEEGHRAGPKWALE